MTSPSVQELNHRRQELEKARKDKKKELDQAEENSRISEDFPGVLVHVGKIYSDLRGMTDELRQVKETIFSLL